MTIVNDPQWQANEERAAYINGLRQLADVLEQNPELQLPYTGRPTGSSINVIPHQGDAQREQLAAWARVLPGRREKDARGEYFDLIGQLAGLSIKVICDRDEVCERVVVGTETVTEKRKDPEALAQVPEIEVTEERDVVEWRCGSVLADEPEAVS